ncbi:CoA-binding protein [Colwellia sp. KU-HH00111]|uniref:CoA-binding protein n=1 Tax=Colwellia sp. KU-HH00111 TaxID=3127652 RepID=UPI0031063DFC
MRKQINTNYRDTEMSHILKNTETIALIGASAKPERDSYKVMAYLIEQGYKVFPVNPQLKGQKIQGCEVYGGLEDIPVAIDMVDVFRQSKYLYDIVVAAKKSHVKFIWAQQGVSDTQAELLALKYNIPMIVNSCPAIEIPRLRR